MPLPHFKCPECGSVSYNPHDLANEYCGRCHKGPAERAQGNGSWVPVEIGVQRGVAPTPLGEMPCFRALLRAEGRPAVLGPVRFLQAEAEADARAIQARLRAEGLKAGLPIYEPDPETIQ